MIDPARLVRLERNARAALPATEEHQAGDWVIRISGGATKRVNSANPVAPGARVGDVIERAEAAYRAWSLPTRFRLTPLAGADADAVLASRGYGRLDDSWTMIVPTAGHSIDPSVHCAATPDDRWYAGYAEVSGWSSGDDAHFRPLLAQAERLLVGSLVEGGRPIGFGIASLVGGQAWLGNIATAPEAQGRGIGRRLVATLLGRAAAEGAAEALLQVLAVNAPARALYRSLGFADLYPYHYRVAGSGE